MRKKKFFKCVDSNNDNFSCLRELYNGNDVVEGIVDKFFSSLTRNTIKIFEWDGFLVEDKMKDKLGNSLFNFLKDEIKKWDFKIDKVKCK